MLGDSKSGYPLYGRLQKRLVTYFLWESKNGYLLQRQLVMSKGRLQKQLVTHFLGHS